MSLKRLLFLGAGWIGTSMSLGTLGCTVDSLVGPPGVRRLSALRITPHAVSMAVGATQQFTVVARDSLGAEIPSSELPAVTYTSQLDTIVTITQTGLATARYTATSLRIVAKIVVDNFAVADTALVNVVATQPAGGSPATFSAGVDITLAAAGTANLTATVRGAPATGASTGTVISTRQPYYVSSNPRIAIVTNTNRVTAIAPGTAQIIGTITAFGVNLTDTVVVTVTNPTSLTVNIVNSDGKPVFGGTGSVTIAPGGQVNWTNGTAIPANTLSLPPTPAIPAIPMDVTFDDPTNVAASTTGGPSGNIPAFTAATVSATQSRRFPVAGTYTYKSTTNGATGVVIVK